MVVRTQDEYRIAVALRCLNLLQDAIENNGNRYSSGLVPNFTSLAVCRQAVGLLSIPYDELIATVRANPELNPDVEWVPVALRRSTARFGIPHPPAKGPC